MKKKIISEFKDNYCNRRAMFILKIILNFHKLKKIVKKNY